MSDIMQDVFIRNRIAEEKRYCEYEAAVQIQAWFRAVRVRSYIRHLHKSATMIQKYWRGYLGRAVFRILVRNMVFIMRHNYYNKMATKVQRIWRGYYVRKYIFDYYARKKYLEGLIIKNEIIRRELEELKGQKESERYKEIQEESNRKLEEYARSHRYLLSTDVVPGIYNSPFKPQPDEMEFMLRNVQPRPPQNQNQKETTNQGLLFHLAHHYRLTEPLPPIGQKPQGPFRKPEEVQKQRYKPLQPTLRVATSYTSIEEARAAMKSNEWVMRVNDNIFVPFTRRDRSYDPLLHTTSKYGHLPYGTSFYRETDEMHHLTTERFQPVVSPIPVFDKLNDTYSKGTETVP